MNDFTLLLISSLMRSFLFILPIGYQSNQRENREGENAAGRTRQWQFILKPIFQIIPRTFELYSKYYSIPIKIAPGRLFSYSSSFEFSNLPLFLICGELRKLSLIAN